MFSKELEKIVKDIKESASYTDKDVEKLETMFVDRFELYRILYMLSRICNYKADHARTNWQDEVAAKNWEKASKMLESLAPKMRGL